MICARAQPQGERTVRIDCLFCFFFSSRRRHTRFDCDWSSDVCSSDLFEIARLSPSQTLLERFFFHERFELFHSGTVLEDLGRVKLSLLIHDHVLTLELCRNMTSLLP